MSLRFSLYGFLKNQRYYEPFLILFFLDQGLTYFQIGLLVAFRELLINLLEVPSGVAADLYGRRRSMISAWLTYLVAFAVFAVGHSLAHFVLAMACLALADAFRSGTHKAMIFDWLASQGRQGEKASFYGKTRSWSQIGSAVSVLIAAGIVLGSADYRSVFLASMIPYGLGLVNFFGYPKFLDGERRTSVSWAAVWHHLRQAFVGCWQVKPLRRLLAESMVQRGTYGAVKNYLQPLLEQAALAIPLFVGWQHRGRTALWVAIVYCVLHLGSAGASRQAHRLEGLGGGPGPTSRKIWWATVAVYVVLVPSLAGVWEAVAIGGFIALALLQNVWKPLFMARVDEASEPQLGATLFSIDSQTKSLFLVLAAPLLGWAVDQWGLVALAWFGCALALLGRGLVAKGPGAARESTPRA